MQMKLKIALVVILLIYIFRIAKSVKRKNMRINYLIFWCIIGLLLIIALFIPNFVINLTNLIGFEVASNMIFSVAIFIILYLIYNLTILISKEERKNTMLIQEISILKKKVNELENKNTEGK